MADVIYPLAGKRVWVAGHRGMVGSALVRRLARAECEVLVADRSELDLRDQAAVADWLVRERPNVVLLAAARAGGILANDTRPVDFLLDNLLIETAVIAGSHRAGSANCCSSDRAASTPSSRRSRSARTRC